METVNLVYLSQSLEIFYRGGGIIQYQAQILL